MSNINKLEKELKALRDKKATANRIKQLKKQIKAEKFSQTKTGKVFNKIADVGEVGRKFLSPQGNYVKKAGKKGSKIIKKNVMSVEDVMAKLPQ